MGVFVVFGIFLLGSSVHAAPGINQQLNFQGRLLTAQGATVADGYYNIQFKIYQDGTGTVAGNPSGTLKWTESWLNANGNGVQVKNGYMSVQLGSITSLSSVDWNQDTLWLSINVGNTNASCTPFTSCSGDGEMLPMKRLGSTPYAFNAGQLGGLTSAQFLQLAQGVQTEAGTNTTAIAINKTGTGGNFLELQSSGVDVFKITNTGDITFGSNIDHAISVSTAAASTAGKALTISAGTAGTGATALTGGTLTLQGGNGGGTGGNGGNLVLDAGAAAVGGSGGTITIGGTNASSITLGQNTTLSGDKSLTITGSGTRPSSPTEGMIYYDTTAKQLIVYSNGKWQGDRSDTTKIVAASNSSQAAKDAADYVATGTSDQTTINTALTAAAGGKVYLMEGTYNTDDAIRLPNNTALTGSGHNSLIQLGNIDGQTKNIIENIDQGGTGEGIVIRDLRIDGLNGTNLTGTMYGIYMNAMGGSSGSTARHGATIANVWVTNVLSDGIRLNNSPNGSITNTTVQGGKANGIYLASSNRSEVSNNTVQGNTGGGIWLAGTVNVTVTGNVVYANATNGISLNGNSHDNTIASNNLANNAGTGANHSINLSSVNNNQIIGNSIVDNGGTGAAIGIDSASASNYLSNNVFNGTGATSISDASTSTVYANQSRSASGGQITNRTANDSQAFTVQNASGSNIFAVDTTNSQVVLGASTTAGKLAISDGSSNTGTIVVGPLSGNYTYTIPTTTSDDTFCLVTLNNCAADSTQFIQNQNASAQTAANFWIAGTGRADTKLLSPELDTATGVALNIGTTAATSVNIGKSTTVTTINGKLGVTLDTTTGTTITCRNTSGYLSVCDSSVLTPSASNFIQNGTSVQTGANFWIDGYGKIAGGVQTGNIDTIGSGGSLNIGTTSAGSLTIGKTGVTTTIQGNIGVTLNATTGTTMVCRNATGLLSSCDATYQAPTATNFIQNQNASAQTSSNFWISGTGMAGTLQASNVIGDTFDTATATALNIGASGTPTTTGINLNQNTTVASGKTLTLAGDTKTNINAIASPVEGTLTYDTSNKQLLVYSNGKWQADRSSAILVAASNSSDADKAAADYVATGTADQTPINNALTAADPTSGSRKTGRVYLFAGTYTINGSISIPNNTTLAGAGAGTVITIPNSTNASFTAITNSAASGSASGIVVQDIKLDGNKANQSAGSYAMYAILFNGVGSSTLPGGKIMNVWAVDWYSNGVAVWTGAGIYITNGTRNTVSNVVVQGGTNNGLTISASTYNTVTGSDFSGNKYGVVLAGNNNTITGNTASGNTANGIYVTSGSQNTISGNVATGNTNTNIYLSGSSSNTISGNQALGSSSNDGIGLSSSSNYNIVSSNIVQSNNTGGISLASTSTNNTITENKIHNNGGNHNKGIYFSNSSSNTVTNNSITDTANSASNNPINIDASTSGTYLSNNTFSSTAGTGTIADAGTGTVYVNQPRAEGGGQITNRTINDASAFTFQDASGVSVLTVDTSSNKVLVAGALDTTIATTLSIGTTTASAITIGSAAITTTIQGSTKITPQTSTSTTLLCTNAGVLSTCDTSVVAPTSTNFIVNGSSQQSGANFNISGTGVAGTLQATNLVGTNLDAGNSSTTLAIGTTSAAINLNQNVTVASGKTLTLAGDTKTNIDAIASPTEGMITYDTTNKQLLTYSNGKWQADRSDAVLVAASNSSDSDKAAADYVANGNTAAAGDGDQVQINQALTAGSGKKVVLLAGTYTVDASVSVPNNTTLAGVGQGVTLTIPNSFNTNINLITNTTAANNGTGIVLQDLTLDGNRSAQSSGTINGIYLTGVGSTSPVKQGARLSGIVTKEWRTNAVVVDASANVSIANSSLGGASNAAIYLSSTSRVVVTGNTIEDSTYGLYLTSAATTTISANAIQANSTGLYATASATNTITGNTVQGNGSYGIALYASSNNNTINGNVVQNNNYTGISIDSSAHNSISGNTLKSNANIGIFLSASSNNAVNSNNVQASTSSSIYLYNGSDSNIVSGNRLHDSDGAADNNGIYVYGSSSNALTSNVISDASATTTNYAININNTSSSNYLADNTLGGGSVNNLGTGTVYGGQTDNSGDFLIQPAGTISLLKDTTVSGTLTATNLVANSLERAAAGTLSIGTNAATTTALSIGSAGVTTTIAGNTGVTLNATTGTTMVCRNASGVLSACDATYLGPTATNFIQNGTSQQASANFNISGTGVATTLQATTLVGANLNATNSSTALTIGTTASVIDLKQNVTVATGKVLTIVGGNYASRPASPAEGSLYYDTDSHQMLQWNGTKWVNNGSDAYLVAASNSSQADKDAADYVATGTGDQATIQSALDRADPASAVSGARKSGKVYLFAGTYTTNDVISVPNDTTLAGAGRGSLIKFANINGQTKNMITNSDTSTGKGATIRDLQLDGNNSVNTSGTMHGIYFSGMGGASGATARQGATIINNWVNNFYSNGVHLSSSPNSTIIGNNIQGNTSNGIYISSSNRSNITNNISQGNGGSGIVLAGAVSENVVANTFAVNGTAGVYINGSSNNNTIFGNNLYNNGGASNNAIYFPTSANGDYNTITNNTINDTSGATSNYAINFADNTSNYNYLADNVFTSTLGTSTINDPAGSNNIYSNQPRAEGGAQVTNRTINDTQAFAFQKADGTNILTVDTTNNKVLVAGTLDTTTAATLNIGTATASAISIGSGSITTTIAGNTGVTLNGTTGTTMVCRNASGLLSTCDATYLAPTASNFIQNQNASAQTTANFWISGTGQAATLTAGTVNATTNLVTPSVDAASAVALTLGGTTASSVDIGKSAGTVNLKANTTLVGTSGGTITVQGAAQSTANTAGNLFALKGSTGNGSGAGGQLTLQGGDGGATSGANGGNVYIAGGNGTGTGVSGLVVMTTPTFSTAIADANCFTGGATVANSCTISSASVNGTGAVLVGFSASGKTATLPDPTISTAGRVIYVTASGASEDFTLSVNGGGQGNQIAMRKNTTATMIWNGADWTAAGASSSTTLQAAYDNTLQSSGGAELVVSKTSATNGLTIRDSLTNSVNGALLNVQSSSAANLFSVNSNVTEYATNSGAESGGSGGGLSDNTFPAGTWSALTSTTATRYTTAGDYIATGQGSVSANVTAATANAGVANKLTGALTPNMTYNVSFSARLASGSFTDMSVYYSVDGSAASVACATNQTAKTSIWSKINCTFQAPSAGITANNAILIRQATGVIRTFYIDNLSVTIAADFNYATDGDVDDNTNFSTNWPYTTGTGTGTVTRNTSDGFNASSSATVAISAGAANAGGRNKLAINPLVSTLYRVSVYAKAATTFNDFKVRYSPDGGSSFVDCVDYNTQSISTTTWTQVTCYIKTSATTVSNPYVYFVETASAARTYYVDAFSMTLASNTTPNVQVGSGSNGGPTTLFTVDKGASAPIAANNDALLGSMYYDTTLGKLQCYEADGWGACGSSPDNIVTISPEYTNAVMHGTGIGTMTSDLCSSTLNINDGTSSQPTICGTNETYNFYKWTSPQATAQTYSIYVTYQLPGTFKEFASGSTAIMGRTDSNNSTVQYQIYRSNSTSGMTTCGGAVTVSTGVKTSWQPGQATGASDPSTCSFVGGDSIVFKISMTSSSNANAYVGNLGFTFSNR